MCSLHLSSVSEDKLAINLEQSYCCLIYLYLIVLFTSLGCVRRETIYKPRTILFLSWNYLITVLLSSSTLLLWVQEETSHHLRTILFLSQNCLITSLLLSYSALPLIYSVSECNLSIILEQSYYCLRTILSLSQCALYTFPLCQRRNYLIQISPTGLYKIWNEIDFL